MATRAITLIALVGLIVTPVSATGTQEAGQTTPAGDAGGETVTVLSGGWFGTNYNQVESTAYIEEKTNTTLDIVSTSWGNEYLSKQQIMMASGDYPEIMVIVDNARELEYASSGALLPLNEHWDTYTNIRESRDPATWDVMRHPDGNVYLVPTSQAAGDGTPISQTRVTLYRQDWLESYDLDVPTTTEQYFDMAEYLVEEDPDGVGTYGIGGYEAALGWFDHVFSAFGAMPHFWMERDGEIISGTVQPGMKDALEFLNRMWDAGLIDPEWITDNKTRWRQKLVTGVHAMPYTFGHIFDSNNVSGGYYQEFKDNVPHGEWTIGTMLTAEGYEDVAFGGTKLSQRGWMRTGIVSRAENIDAALRVLDFMTSSEGTMLYNYGLEGDHYEIRPDGSVDFFATEEEIAEFGINLRLMPIVRTTSWAHATPEYQEHLKRWEKFRVGDVTDMYLLEEVSRYQPDLEDYANEELVKMIVGDVPIEGGFEEFVAEFNRRGGDQLRAALREAASR